jgi:hypothetical protein
MHRRRRRQRDLKKPRNQQGVTNVRGGKHLNEYVHDLTAEARRCWGDWIASTGNQRLKDLLEAAEASAQNDVSRLRGLMQ